MDTGFAQHFLECTTCDSNAQFHCNTCQFDLCQDCKYRHQRRQVTSNHDVVPYSQRKEAPTQERCKVHPDKIYDACCDTCEMPVCMNCVKELHNGHTFIDIEDVFKVKMDELMSFVRRLRDGSLAQSIKLETQIERNKETCKNGISKIRSDLQSTAQDIKHLVDVILEEKNQILTAIEESLMLEFLTQEKKILEFILSTKALLKENETIELTSNHAEFLITQKERVLAISKMLNVPELPEVFIPTYQKKTFQQNDIEKLVGSINDTSAELKRGAKIKKAPTLPLSDEKNWDGKYKNQSWKEFPVRAREHEKNEWTTRKPIYGETERRNIFGQIRMMSAKTTENPIGHRRSRLEQKPSSTTQGRSELRTFSSLSCSEAIENQKGIHKKSCTGKEGKP